MACSFPRYYFRDSAPSENPLASKSSITGKIKISSVSQQTKFIHSLSSFLLFEESLSLFLSKLQSVMCPSLCSADSSNLIRLDSHEPKIRSNPIRERTLSIQLDLTLSDLIRSFIELRSSTRAYTYTHARTHACIRVYISCPPYSNSHSIAFLFSHSRRVPSLLELHSVPLVLLCIHNAH